MTAALRDQKQTTITVTARCHCSQARLLHIWWEKDADQRGLIPANQPDRGLQIATLPMVVSKFRENRCEAGKQE